MSPTQDCSYEYILKLRAEEHARNCAIILGYSYQGNTSYGGHSPTSSSSHTKNNVAGFYSNTQCGSEAKYSSYGYSRSTENGTYRSLSG